MHDVCQSITKGHRSVTLRICKGKDDSTSQTSDNYLAQFE